MTSSKILQILASERSFFAANEVVKSVVLGMERRQLEIAAEEVNWLKVPVNTYGEAKVRIIIVKYYSSITYVLYS